MIDNKFKHQHAAHCESGVLSSLLCNNGLQLSEPMAFALGGGLSFAYLPFIKIGGFPLIAYRMPPRSLIKNLAKNIGITMERKFFKSAQAGEDFLNQRANENKITGVQSSVFWLPYFPEEMRFHFNAHNLIVYGMQDDDYLISDPVFEDVVKCPKKDLTKARFVKGILAPKGFVYYPTNIPSEIDYQPIIRKSIRKTCRMMLSTPMPIIGVKGIKYLGKNVKKLQKKDSRYARLYLGHIVRMQEEIGTGGAGFRFLYASFLDEASKITDNKNLKEISLELTQAGDMWRAFALEIAKYIKGKNQDTFTGLQLQLNKISQAEKSVYKNLLKAMPKK